MSEQVQLPSVPTEHELAREFSTRPNWDALEQLIRDETGKGLYDDKDFGFALLAEIQDADASVRDYLKVYDRKSGVYWDSVWGQAEKALEDSLALFKKPRIAEVNRGEQFRANALRIMGEYKQADDEAAAAKQKEIERQQREAAEKDKQGRLNDLSVQLEEAERDDNMFLVEDIQVQIDAIKLSPALPPSVSPTQARAALGTPAMPAGIVSNKRPTYDRLITDKRAFIAWLAAHPAYIDVIAMNFSFTNIKHSPVEIDGVTMSLKMSVQNRGK